MSSSTELENILSIRDVLSVLLEEEKMVSIPLLVLTNKQDLQRVLLTNEVGERMKSL